MLPFDFVVDVVVAAADVVDAHFGLLMFLLSVNDAMISAIANNFCSIRAYKAYFDSSCTAQYIK